MEAENSHLNLPDVSFFSTTKMKSRLDQSRFSNSFNRLGYLGMWSWNLSNPTHIKVFKLYRFLCTLALIIGMILQGIDLFIVFGNFRKVAYNFCTSIIVSGLAVKLSIFHKKKRILTELRWSLLEDSVKNNQPEDIAIYDSAYDQLMMMQKLFYASLLIFHPIWIICSYFSYLWGPRQLAFAAYMPMEDPLDDRFFVPALVNQAIGGFYFILVVIEAELAMFSIMLQLEACYQILCKDVLKLNEIYGDENIEGGEFSKLKKEVNVYLKKETALKLLNSLIIRQLEILNYLKLFEAIYSPCMLLQLTAGSILLVMNGLELSMFAEEMSAKLFFQTGYAVLILVDIFLVCYHLSRLSTECMNVGAVAYSTAWYRMDGDLRKRLCMIIMRSQKPPKVTVGKLFTANLNTYLDMLRNIYSWLMLFRQLGSK